MHLNPSKRTFRPVAPLRSYCRVTCALSCSSMGSNRRLPASAVGRPRHDRTRPALYPDLYPAEERRRASPNKQDSECHQLSQGSTDTCPSPELHSSAEEHRNSSPAEEVPQRSQFGRGGDVFFPNKPHHSDASWRGPPPLEETRPKEFSNREDRQRGQRLFGNVTGALARDQTDIAQQTREARRKQIELRQKAKLKAETFLWESNRQRKRRTERHEMNEDSAKAFLERDAVSFSITFARTYELLLKLPRVQMIARHAKNLVDARYLKTITEPVLVYLENSLYIPRLAHAPWLTHCFFSSGDPPNFEMAMKRSSGSKLSMPSAPTPLNTPNL